MLNSNLPTLDLHGECKVTAKVLINEFITDNIKIGNNKILIIHGIGSGVLKKETHHILEKDKRVESFYLDFFNVGSTVVKLKNVDK